MHRSLNVRLRVLDYFGIVVCVPDVKEMLILVLLVCYYVTIILLKIDSISVSRIVELLFLALCSTLIVCQLTRRTHLLEHLLPATDDGAKILRDEGFHELALVDNGHVAG